ncbi:MAG: hypothetical protein RSB59_06505 [Clostridia bacterium]
MNKKKIISIIAIIALVAVLGVCLVACNADSYEKKLTKAGYDVTVSTAEDIKEFDKEDGEVVWALVGAKVGSFDGVSIIKFKKTDDAKKYATKMGVAAGLANMEVYRSGSIVIIATKKGIKDAK